MLSIIILISLSVHLLIFKAFLLLAEFISASLFCLTRNSAWASEAAHQLAPLWCRLLHDHCISWNESPKHLRFSLLEDVFSFDVRILILKRTENTANNLLKLLHLQRCICCAQVSSNDVKVNHIFVFLDFPATNLGSTNFTRCRRPFSSYQLMEFGISVHLVEEKRQTSGLARKT